MIELALAISTVALGGYAYAKRRRCKRLASELEESHKHHAWAMNNKNTLIEELENDVVEHMEALAENRRRYEAALRALRTRQAVIDGLARERDFAVTNAESWQQQWIWESKLRRGCEATLRGWQATAAAEGNKAARLAAQLKRMKARSK